MLNKDKRRDRIKATRTAWRQVGVFAVATTLAASVLTAGTPSAQARTALAPREGFVNVEGGPVWYRVFGSGKGTPLLIVHGGPGSRSCTYEPLADIVGKDRPVIVYDEARPETVARFQAMIPGARLAVIEDCGHMAPLEDPEGYARILNAFFKEK